MKLKVFLSQIQIFWGLIVFLVPVCAQAGLHDTLDSFYESLARSSQLYYGSCKPQKKPEDCDLKSDATEALRESALELNKMNFLTGLANERAKDFQCAVSQLDRMLPSKGEEYKTHLADAEKKMKSLATEILASMRLSAKAKELQLSRRPEDKAQLVELQKKMKKKAIEISAIENSIPYSETEPVQKMIQQCLQESLKEATTMGGLLQENLGPKTIDSAQFARDYESTLKVVQGSLKKDLDYLKQGVASTGKTLDRTSRESLMQDLDLVESYTKQHPESQETLKPAICELKITYEKGAQARDQAMTWGSAGLTFGSLGLGVGGRGLLALGAGTTAPARLAAAAGLMSVRTSRILGPLGMVIDPVTGLKAHGEACHKYQSQISVSPASRDAKRCENFSLKSLEQNNCALSYVMDLGGTAVAGTALATEKAAAVVASRLGIAEAPAVASSAVNAESRVEKTAKAASAVVETPTKNLAGAIRPLGPKTAEEYMKVYGQKTFNTKEEYNAFREVALKGKNSGKITSIEIENSMQKRLNTVLGKNKVDAMNARFIETFTDQISALQKEYPGLKLAVRNRQDAKAADYKGISLVFDGEMPPALRKRIDEAYQNSQKIFVDEAKRLKLVPEGENPGDYFRAAGGRSVDDANQVARVARGLSGENRVYWDDEKLVQQMRDDYFKQTESFRQEVERDLKGTRFLEDVPGTDKQIPDRRLFDMARREPDTDKLMANINNHFEGANLRKDEVASLQNYVEMADQANPRVFPGERQFANMADAEKGGFSTDKTGMGAINSHATAKALAQSKNYEEATEKVRAAERKVTASFEASSREQANKVVQLLERKKQLGKVETICSGDDCVYKVSTPLNAPIKQEMIQRFSKTERPSGLRVSFINDKVVQKLDRDLLSSHGETIEKKLREALSGKVPADTLDNLTFGVDMKGTQTGQGGVGLIIGNSRVRLTPKDRSAIDEAFKKAVQRVNENQDFFRGGSGSYTVAP